MRRLSSVGIVWVLCVCCLPWLVVAQAPAVPPPPIVSCQEELAAMKSYLSVLQDARSRAEQQAAILYYFWLKAVRDSQKAPSQPDPSLVPRGSDKND